MDHWFAILILTPDVFAKRHDLLFDLGVRGFVVQKARTCHLSSKQVSLILEDTHNITDPDALKENEYTSYLALNVYLTSGVVMILKLHARNPGHNPIERLHVILDPSPKESLPTLDQIPKTYYATCDTPFLYTHTWQSTISLASVLDIY